MFFSKLWSKAILALLIVALSGCASGPKFEITSSTPARIERDGRTVCESTPCSVGGNHFIDGFGLACVRGAYTYLEAFPLDRDSGYTQQKRVWGECNDKGDIYFDMQSRPGVQTIEEGRGSGQ